MSSEDEKFSDDPEEHLRMENELLKLKLQAQFGAQMGMSENLPPNVENEFLKNVFAFEQNLGEYKAVKVLELLGNPNFPKANGLSEVELTKEYQQLLKLLKEKSMAVDFIRPRSERFMYQFITEELFQHETDGGMPGLAGMTRNFIYEEFHIDHELEIQNRTKDFLRSWFNQSFSESSMELNETFVLPDKQILSREEVLTKIQVTFDCYTSFTNCKVAMQEIKFQWNDETQTGMGHAEGAVKYDAISESGETIHVEGPFKLYLSSEAGWWSVFYFVFPGFSW